jgi:hypothetical protein
MEISAYLHIRLCGYQTITILVYLDTNPYLVIRSKTLEMYIDHIEVWGLEILYPAELFTAVFIAKS